jgi:uncharacterized membrane protein YuzA (DUF378 family)
VKGERRRNVRVLALVLVILGALALGYQGFTYEARVPIDQVGSVEVATAKQQTVWIPPVVGGIAIVSGLILLVSSTRRE